MEFLMIPGMDSSQRLRQMREESKKRMMRELQRPLMAALLSEAIKKNNH